MEPLSAVLPKVASLLMLHGVRPSPNPVPRWYRTDQFCDFHRVVGHSTNSCITLRGTVQDLIDRKVITINTQEAASTSTPPSASTSALGSPPPNPSIVHQPLPEHSGPGGMGTSGIHSLFPSGSATSVVDPFDLIQHTSVLVSSSLYRAALAGFESRIHMIRQDARPEHAVARPAI